MKTMKMPMSSKLSITDLHREMIAGLTLAALAIPEVMAYTKIAGTPVITGLYTMLIPVVLFALIGSSRHLVVGADSATAAMLSVGLAGMAAVGSNEYVALAGVLALLSALLLLIARFFRLGFLANFLSRTVLIGFLTGVGIQVALAQIAPMLGMHGPKHGSFFSIAISWWHMESFHPLTIALSLSVLAIIIICRRISHAIPGPLIAVAVAIFLSWKFNLDQQGVAILGEIPSGLPHIALPDINWSFALISKLLPVACGLFVVILAQSAATSRAYADRYNEQVSTDRDLVGLAAANIGAALSGTFVVNGSPTKTQMVDSAGGRNQLAQLFSALVVFLVLLFFTAPLAYMPEAVLATIVFMIGVELVNIKGMKQIFKERPWEFWVALATAIIVIFWGVQQGILLAIVLSLIVHTRHGYKPNNRILVNDKKGNWRALPVSQPQAVVPGLMIYRFNHSMYYANSTQLAEEVQSLIKEPQPPLKWFCIDCTAVDDIDFSAAATLRSLLEILHKRQIHLVFSMVSDTVRHELERSALVPNADEADFFSAISDVVDAYQAKTSGVG